MIQYCTPEDALSSGVFFSKKNIMMKNMMVKNIICDTWIDLK